MTTEHAPDAKRRELAFDDHAAKLAAAAERSALPIVERPNDPEAIDIEAILQTRLKRAPADNERRSHYIAAEAARRASRKKVRAAIRRVEAAAASGDPVNPADLAMAMSVMKVRNDAADELVEE